MAWLAEVAIQNFVSWLSRATFGSRYSTARLRYGTGCATIRRRMSDDTASGRGLGSRYSICIVTEGRDIERDKAYQRARARNDTTAYAHDTIGRARSDTVRHGHDTAAARLRHDQARPDTSRSARAVCAQAGPRVGALCTRLSFDSVHCSESLFGTLFMSTVHEVFKK